MAAGLVRGGKRLRLVATYAKGASKRQVRNAQQQHMPERSPNDGSPLEETALDIRQAIESAPRGVRRSSAG